MTSNGRPVAGSPRILLSVEVTFDTVLRGYDPRQVDELLDQADQALASDRWYVRKAALDALRSAGFRRRLSGYDRDQVDRFIQELIRRLD
jgi:DivIVA domain-containing protein